MSREMGCFTIPMQLPGYNEQSDADRRNKYTGAKLRRSTEEQICMFAKVAMNRGDLMPVEEPCRIQFIWQERTKKRDLDNIYFAKKYILDALQMVGVLPNDSQEWVIGMNDEIIHGNTDQVKVVIREGTEDEDNQIEQP